MGRRLLFVFVLVLGVGCGGGSGDPPAENETGTTGGGEAAGAEDVAPAADDEVPAEPEEDEGPIAEVPFPAAQIRDATAAGRTYVFEFREGGRVRYERWVFAEVSPTGWVMDSTPVDEDGEPTGETERGAGTWMDLERHAHFPAGATEITNAVLTLPLARFRCQLYTVTTTDEAGHAVVGRFWFATDLPGAPVRMVREVDGETVVEMQIVRHEPPI